MPQPLLNAQAVVPAVITFVNFLLLLKLAPSCCETIKKICSNNKLLAPHIIDFLKTRCVKKVLGAGANGIIFWTYQGCVVKVAFSTYHHSDYYETEDGDIRSKTLDLIIQLGLTSLTGYEILLKGHTLVVHEYHALQSYTLNELLTYTSTLSFIKTCLVQLMNIVVKYYVLIKERLSQCIII